MQANDRAIVATDQRSLLVKLNFLGRITGIVGEALRLTRLAPCAGIVHRVDSFGEPLVVGFRFFNDIGEAVLHRPDPP